MTTVDDALLGKGAAALTAAGTEGTGGGGGAFAADTGGGGGGAAPNLSARDGRVRAAGSTWVTCPTGAATGGGGSLLV